MRDLTLLRDRRFGLLWLGGLISLTGNWVLMAGLPLAVYQLTDSTLATGGIFIVPLIALLFLISSFFAKVPGGIKWSLIVFGLTVLQVALGLFSHEVAGLGWLHGLNALLVFGTAVTAGMRVTRAVATMDVADEPVAAATVS